MEHLKKRVWEYLLLILRVSDLRPRFRHRLYLRSNLNLTVLDEHHLAIPRHGSVSKCPVSYATKYHYSYGLFQKVFQEVLPVPH